MNKLCDCKTCMATRNELDAAGWPVALLYMNVCSVCGNKRCPKATDHVLACTGSNEPGQEGSWYV
jgi:hypothetical protein